MMNKNPFLKRLMKEESANVVHSSAYAEAQNEGNIGATSTQSFAERQRIEANRTTVRGYRDSKVVNDAFGSVGNKLQSYDAAHDASQRAAVREKFGGGRNTGTAGVGSKNESGKIRGDSMGGQSRIEKVGRTMPTERTAVPPARRNPGI